MYCRPGSARQIYLATCRCEMQWQKFEKYLPVKEGMMVMVVSKLHMPEAMCLHCNNNMEIMSGVCVGEEMVLDAQEHTASNCPASEDIRVQYE